MDTSPIPASPPDIVSFWIAAGPARWFAKDAIFDAAIRARFLDAHESAARGELAGWIDNAGSTLALILLTDQFPRNLYRGSAHAFATDPIALAAARESLRRGHDALSAGDETISIHAIHAFGSDRRSGIMFVFVPRAWTGGQYCIRRGSPGHHSALRSFPASQPSVGTHHDSARAVVS